MKTKIKLIRNLRAGEQFQVKSYDDREATVTALRVQETSKGCSTRRRRWEIIATYPWWWAYPVVGYSDTPIEVVGVAPPQQANV